VPKKRKKRHNATDREKRDKKRVGEEDGEDVNMKALFEGEEAEASASAAGSPEKDEVADAPSEGTESSGSDQESSGENDSADQEPARKRRRLQCDCCLEFSDEPRVNLWVFNSLVGALGPSPGGFTGYKPVIGRNHIIIRCPSCPSY